MSISFEKTIVQLRKRMGISQEQAAKSLGISRSSLANYETGIREPKFEVLEAMADFYNVSIDELIGKTEPANPNELTEGDRLLFSALRGATEAEKIQAAKIIEALRR